MTIDQANFALMVGDYPKEPATFKEAWDHAIKDHKSIWQEAIEKEFKEIHLRGV